MHELGFEGNLCEITEVHAFSISFYVTFHSCVTYLQYIHFAPDKRTDLSLDISYKSTDSVPYEKYMNVQKVESLNLGSSIFFAFRTKPGKLTRYPAIRHFSIGNQIPMLLKHSMTCPVHIL